MGKMVAIKMEKAPRIQGDKCRCSRCKEYKPLESFKSASPSHMGEKAPYCAECSSIASFISRYTKKLKENGPEAFLKEIEEDQEKIKLRYELLTKYLQKQAKE